MPAGGGPVYQPTTVSYGPRNGGAPLRLLSSGALGTNSPLQVFRKPRPRFALLVFAVITISAGLAMLTSSLVDWLEAYSYAKERAIDEGIIECPELLTCTMLLGTLVTCVGITAMTIFLKFSDWRRNCICPCPFFDKKQSLARQLQCQNGGCGQGIMALNPSTDPLVSHSLYATVSELPSLRPEDEERRNLMPENKECVSSAEESDRMLEPDPRIVLRPMGRVEDA